MREPIQTEAFRRMDAKNQAAEFGRLVAAHLGRMREPEQYGLGADHWARMAQLDAERAAHAANIALGELL